MLDNCRKKKPKENFSLNFSNQEWSLLHVDLSELLAVENSIYVSESSGTKRSGNTRAKQQNY